MEGACLQVILKEGQDVTSAVVSFLKHVGSEPAPKEPNYLYETSARSAKKFVARLKKVDEFGGTFVKNDFIMVKFDLYGLEWVKEHAADVEGFSLYSHEPEYDLDHSYKVGVVESIIEKMQQLGCS
eukprot:TRINITY_DN104576_c0_g1_i1.p2 TRINITY_DN104576_c0_g1~~TRINITY_DN104576_c0_g1_i1.p2  ORF type:complete len:126 (-),score=8.84 TRINITY_DN104576_c0_g1_i1:241-618(-)